MKDILAHHIKDDESSMHLLRSVCAGSKSGCNKAKAALEDEDQPVAVRIETAVGILNHVIAYVDEVSKKRRLEDPLSDFEFAEEQADKNGQIAWKAHFQQWKVLGRFEQYKTYKSAQSAYHRAMKKKKQQAGHQQDRPALASSSSSHPGAK
ncbi:hypothetical protein V8B55DRAFT_1512080 [Mucor lusitanicus]